MNTYNQTHRKNRMPIQENVSGKNQKFNIVDNRSSSIQMAKIIQSINLGPIQCYMNGREYNTSTNKIYRTSIADKNMLDIKKGITIPTPLIGHLKPIDSTNATYNRYEFNAIPYNEETNTGNFVNDCGYFAAFLMTGNRDALKGAVLTHSRADNQQKIFNSITPLNAPNEKANPNIEEAYFMGKSSTFIPGCPHHAAAVVAKDGGDNITCEANAGEELEEPIFDMYGTLEPSQTFYEKQKSGFGDATYPAFTQVLEKE